jgi:hypothetical protein
MDFINDLKKEREVLQKKLDAINSVILSYEDVEHKGSVPSEKVKMISGFPKNGSYLEKVFFIIKDANRFLHNSEIAETLSQYDKKDIITLKRRVSAVLSHAKHEFDTLTSVRVGNSIKNTFWGSKEWLDDKGKVKKEHLYNIEAIGGEPKKVMV